MGLFKRDNHNDEWDILSDEEYEVYQSQLQEVSKKKKISKTKKYESQNKHKSNIEKKSKSQENPSLVSPSPVFDQKSDNTELNFLDKDNGYLFEKEDIQKEMRKTPKWPFIILAIVLCVSSLGIIGYINTDFDEDGNIYVIPLNIHYKRRYALMSDKVLDYLNDISGSLENNIQKLPTDYLSISNKITGQIEILQKRTDTLSRYTNVPKDLLNYHSALLNFSLLSQEYLQNLINSYNKTDYEEFAYNGLSDFRAYLQEINLLRQQMDSVLFSNMDNTQETQKNQSTNKKTSDKTIQNTQNIQKNTNEEEKQNNTSNSLFPKEQEDEEDNRFLESDSETEQSSNEKSTDITQDILN